MTQFLSISSDDLTAEISRYGAALARLWLRGHPTSLVLGLPRPEDYASAPHAIGVIVGPIAGRVSNARVEIGGRTYRMDANAPPHCLHSGPDGLQHRTWEVVRQSGNRLGLRCVLADGACGLPGNRTVTAVYEVSGTSLTITITTETDADTLVNATSHAYWTLDAAGDLSTHRLTVNARRMVETGPVLIPTGRLLDTPGGPFDFSSPRNPLSGPPVDACFCLDPVDDGSLTPALHLQSLRSGLQLAVDTNQPGVVLYAGEHLPELPAPRETAPIRAFSALAIEPQGWPDAANCSGFPSIFVENSANISQISRFSFEIP